MKILFTRFPLESSYGGAEVQTISLMRGLLERGHAVAFAGSCPTLLKLCSEHGIPATKVEIGPPPVTKKDAITFAWRKQRMQQLLQSLLDQFHDLDAVMMLSLSEKLLLTDYAATKGVKPLWIEHDTVGRWLRSNPWKPLLLRQSEHATTVVVSGLSKTLYEELGWDPASVIAIPNGIKEVEPITLLHNNPLHIGCIARLSAEKGVDVLIKAMSGIEGATLTIVGRGQERDALIKTAQRFGVTQSVVFQDPLNAIDPFYRKLDLLVLPSRIHDPFGMVAAEAMMRGIPVIVTDACGIAGYLQNVHDAFIVPADSPEALHEAIKHLVTDRTLRETLRENGIKTARERFSLAAMTDAYEKILKKG